MIPVVSNKHVFLLYFYIHFCCDVKNKQNTSTSLKFWMMSLVYMVGYRNRITLSNNRKRVSSINLRSLLCTCIQFSWYAMQTELIFWFHNQYWVDGELYSINWNESCSVCWWQGIKTDSFFLFFFVRLMEKRTLKLQWN